MAYLAYENPKIEFCILSKIKRKDMCLFNVFTSARISKLYLNTISFTIEPTNAIKPNIQDYENKVSTNTTIKESSI